MIRHLIRVAVVLAVLTLAVLPFFFARLEPAIPLAVVGIVVAVAMCWMSMYRVKLHVDRDGRNIQIRLDEDNIDDNGTEQNRSD